MLLRNLSAAVLLAAVMLDPSVASAQSSTGAGGGPPVAALTVPRWQASGLVGLGFVGSDPLVGGTWTLSGAVRVRQRLAIAVEVGRQGYGNVHCQGAECRVGATSDLCPCDEPYRLFSGSRYLAGPRVQVSKNVFAHVLVGAVTTGIMPARFSIRPAIGRDFGHVSGAVRIQADYEIVARQNREGTMSGLRLLIGFAAFGGRQ